MSTSTKKNRREQILQALAHMLETNPGQRITTAKLAKEVGVSEAALYRHFPSKARMFEGLITFIEDSILAGINQILNEEKDTITRCHHILHLLLVFTERNPGITRIMTGDALQGEHERLGEQISALYAKIETHFKQVLREKKMREATGFSLDEGTLANLLLAYAEGRINQYVRTRFALKPTTDFDQQWNFLHKQLLQS
ncbi:nucleoid occlusion factor SlmA [Moritella sp. 28]|uniref:nucleoid occlusion factor SlmA n=1 Tax=Moritella sp. 28 TaxID=2746232 RepID=UPI001BAB11EC|nr:nucleoid occlusion factor SlmA [Moritella sp. 28]QUM86937.1 nucleoid occlusion factor SlmA [Moritella sp. 28]